MSFVEELKRRNVFRVAIAYLALAWLLIEIADTLFPVFDAPEWYLRLLVILLAMGFLPSLVFSWAYEITPQGLKREKEVDRSESIVHITAKRLDWVTIILVSFALAIVAIDRLWLDALSPADLTTTHETSGASADVTGTHPVYPSNTIAVLPFANRSARSEDVYFVEGIHHDLLNKIAQIDSITSISRTSVMQYKDATTSVRDIARELRVATILEGSVQRAGDKVRINVELIDASSDEYFWSRSYDRQLTAANIFAIQSEIAGEVAAALRTTLSPELPT